MWWGQFWGVRLCPLVNFPLFVCCVFSPQVFNDDRQGNLILEGPPDLNIAPPGYYMLFLLNGDSYSTAQWVHLA